MESWRFLREMFQVAFSGCMMARANRRTPVKHKGGLWSFYSKVMITETVLILVNSSGIEMVQVEGEFRRRR